MNNFELALPRTTNKNVSKKKSLHKKPCGCGGNEITKSKGELVITVIRSSFTLNMALPYCIWGSLYINTSFGVVLQEFLPPGITVTTNLDDFNNLRFIYTDGVNTDTITVGVPTIGLISYPEILSNLNTNYMRSNMVLFNCNADDNAPFLTNQQINNLQSAGLFLGITGGGGSRTYKLVIPSTRKEINNSVPNLTQLYLNSEPIKPETVWVHQFAYLNPNGAQLAGTFTFTVFISERIDMNKERQKKIGF